MGVTEMKNSLLKYGNMLIDSVNFREAHISNHSIHLTETFAVRLLQIDVLDVSPRKVLVPILLIKLTK